MPTLTLLSPVPFRRLSWLHQAGIAVHAVRLLPDQLPTAHQLTPPLLLDTPDVDPGLLCRLLCRLPPQLATLALVAPDDRPTSQLLRLCPAVMLFCAPQSDPVLLRSWLELFGHGTPAAVTPAGPCFLAPVPALPAHDAPPLLLRLLPVLRVAETWEEVAQAVSFSPRHLRRQIGQLRARLHLPQQRVPPRIFSQQVLAALDTVPPATTPELEAWIVGQGDAA